MRINRELSAEHTADHATDGRTGLKLTETAHVFKIFGLNRHPYPDYAGRRLYLHEPAATRGLRYICQSALWSSEGFVVHSAAKIGSGKTTLAKKTTEIWMENLKLCLNVVTPNLGIQSLFQPDLR